MYKVKRFSRIDESENLTYKNEILYSESLSKRKEKAASYEATTTAHLIMFLHASGEIGSCADHWADEMKGFIKGMGKLGEKSYSYSLGFPHFLGGETTGYNTTINAVLKKFKDENSPFTNKYINMVKNEMDTVVEILRYFVNLLDEVKNKLKRFMKPEDTEKFKEILIKVKNKYNRS